MVYLKINVPWPSTQFLYILINLCHSLFLPVGLDKKSQDKGPGNNVAGNHVVSFGQSFLQIGIKVVLSAA